MKNNNIKFLILSFVTVFTLQVVGAYTAPNGSPTSNNRIEPMNATTSDNEKYAGLAVKEFVSGNTSTIVVDTVGNVGVNTDTPASDARLYVKGSVKINDLKGTGTRRICAGTTGGSAEEGYPLVICP
ncbi:MAG: hypothetical protein QG566_374 [Patescibacteria group bacterium]|jgi:hypothetical protein|nr:hypothetical protein [Patescibacteria group bacterium]